MIITAQGYESAQGFLVLAGSTAVTAEKPSIHAYLSSLRKQLKQQGVLVGDGERLKLTQDYEFSSSSTAAGVLVGSPISGPQSWKDSSGRTLKQIQESAGET